jgi:hypothetical protein
MALHQEILRSLQNAARKRLGDRRARKSARRNTLGARGYHNMRKQLNDTKFLAPIDARTTQANIYYIKKRFMRYIWPSYFSLWSSLNTLAYCPKVLS